MAIPTTMQVAVYRKPGEVVVEERGVPEPGPEEVLLEVSHCGICGTDLHVVLEGMGRPNSVGGHEYAGTIAAVGERVSDWRVGDDVVGGAPTGCGRCHACRAGRPALCEEKGGFGSGEERMGAFADYKLVSAANLVAVPEGVTLREAALTEPLAVALHAITVSGIEPKQRAVVTGAGPLGLLLIAALRAHGVDDILVSEPAPARRAQAERVGARVVAPEALEVPPMPFTIVDQACDAAFECSGHPEAMTAALAQLRRLGTYVIVGTGMRRAKWDHNRVLMNELQVTGAYNYDSGGFDAALELLASGALPTELLIDPDDEPLEGVLAAIEALGRGERSAKVMIAPRSNPSTSSRGREEV